MKKRLVIDSQLAAQDPAGVFDGDWSWPVAQSEYDDPITEFIEWSDELHSEISDSPQLLNAFLLVKADLLKDLSDYASAWTDIAWAKRNGTEPVFTPNQYIFESLISNDFGNHLPTELLRKGIVVGLRGRLRTRLSRFKRARINKRALSGTRRSGYLIGANHLGQQIAPDGAQQLRLSACDIGRRRSNDSEPPGRVVELARQISESLVQVISRHGEQPSSEFAAHAAYIASQYLRKGWNDAGMAPLLSAKQPATMLVTGTGSGYAARLVSYQFLSDGHDVIRATHGGDPPLFDDVMWPSVEFPFASRYVVHGEVAAGAVSSALAQRSESKVANYTRSVVAAGSDFHAGIREAAENHEVRPVKTVSVAAASFTGMHRVTPHMKLHDVVYMEWHRRLIGDIRRLGYTVISKRHPKGLMPDQPIFGDVADEELLGVPMSAIERRTDAYVIDFPASAFMEAICTPKPVVLIDIPIRKMRPEARELISRSVAIVSATFDERNRVIIDRSELHEGLEKPVDIDARERLIQDYLLRPSADFGSIFE